MDEETGKCKGVVTDDKQTFHCDWLIASPDYLCDRWLPKGREFGYVHENHKIEVEISLQNRAFRSWIARSVVVTSSPLVETEDPSMLSYSVIPLDDGTAPILVLHQNNESMACPLGKCKLPGIIFHALTSHLFTFPLPDITYFWQDQYDSTTLQEAINALLKNLGNSNERGPGRHANECKAIIPEWTLSYDQRKRHVPDLAEYFHTPDNVIPCSDPTASLDFESATREAKAAFYKIMPSETEFMPPQKEDEHEEVMEDAQDEEEGEPRSTATRQVDEKESEGVEAQDAA